MNAIEVIEVTPEEVPLDLLLLADPSVERVRSWLNEAVCCVARLGEETVGVVAVTRLPGQGFELMNIAVRPDCQSLGIGSRLLKRAIELAKERGGQRIELGTGTFGHQLAFYQRVGFRAESVDRDFFLNNYPEPIFESGIQHKDMLRLSLDLRP